MDIIKEDCLRVMKQVNLVPLKGKRVLVTGANGLIGEYLVALLHHANETQKLNCKITGVSLHGPNQVLKKFLPNKNLAFKRADLSKKFSIPGKFDYIFHAAGYGQPAKFLADPFSTIHVNVGATQTLLEVAKKSKGTFCFFSSAEVYGEIPKVAGGIEETYTGSIDTTNPRAIYGESKRLGEALTATYARMYNVRSKIFRISHLYGPGISIKDTRVLGDFIRKALTEKKIVLMDEGKAVKTFGYIADAIAMMVHIALYGKDMVYHVGGRDSISILGLAEAVAGIAGAKVEVPAAKSSKAHIGVDPRFVGLNMSKVLNEMRGKQFAFTSMQEGLRRTIAWNKAEFTI